VFFNSEFWYIFGQHFPISSLSTPILRGEEDGSMLNICKGRQHKESNHQTLFERMEKKEKHNRNMTEDELVQGILYACMELSQ
jgi:hypothetical protein